MARKASNRIAIVGVLAVAVEPLIFTHSMIAYTNLSYVIFFSLGCIYLWQWFQQSDTAHFWLACLLIGFSTWVRSTEPFWILLPIVTVIGYVQKRQHLLTYLLGLAVFWLLKSSWPLYLQYLAITFPPLTAIQVPLTLSNLVSHLGQTVVYLTTSVTPVIWPWLPVLLYCMYLDWRQRRTSQVIEYFSYALFLGMLFAGTYVLSFTFETWNKIGGSVERMIMFLPPLFIYTITTHPVMKTLFNEKK